MPNLSLREIVGSQRKAGIVFLLLAGIEAVCVLPFAYLLPSPSKVPLVVAVGLVAAVNSAMFATVTSKAWSVALLAVNLVGIGFSLRMALDPSRFLSSTSHLAIGLMCLGVFVLGFFKLPKGLMRSFLPAQQWALACTLISWMLVQQLHTQLGTLPAMDVRALFIGPPAVAAAALLSGFTGWKRWYIVAWVGAGLVQYWIGLFDLAGHLDAPLVGRAVLGLMAGFLLVLVATATPGGVAFVTASGTAVVTPQTQQQKQAGEWHTVPHIANLRSTDCAGTITFLSVLYRNHSRRPRAHPAAIPANIYAL